ncbi:MAG: hypothetical protein GX868_01100 [Actinobacteria bacterium]|nr:hypothetical protein [Actinomycetota bacterium]
MTAPIYSSSFTPPGPKTFDPDEHLEHDVFHRIMVGAVSGFLLVGVIVFLGAPWAGLGAVSALGVGAFSGFWSGSISGGMVGGLTVIDRENAKLAQNDPDSAALH